MVWSETPTVDKGGVSVEKGKPPTAIPTHQLNSTFGTVKSEMFTD